MSTKLGVVSSISRTGAYEPFELQVSRGQITYHSVTYPFGINTDVGTSAETVWLAGGSYTFPASAIQMTVSSASAEDDPDKGAGVPGTGAWTVTVEGLDANYNVISETVTMNGQTAVTTTNSFLRVNRMYVATTGTGKSAAGAIYIGTGTVTTGVPATIYNILSASTNVTESGFYTVPAGYTAYIYDWMCSSGNTTPDEFTTFQLFRRPQSNGVFYADATIRVPGCGFITYEAKFPFPIPEKSDLEIRAVTSAGAANVSTQLQIVLVKNFIEK